MIAGTHIVVTIKDPTDRCMACMCNSLNVETAGDGHVSGLIDRVALSAGQLDLSPVGNANGRAQVLGGIAGHAGVARKGFKVVQDVGHGTIVRQPPTVPDGGRCLRVVVAGRHGVELVGRRVVGRRGVQLVVVRVVDVEEGALGGRGAVGQRGGRGRDGAGGGRGGDTGSGHYGHSGCGSHEDRRERRGGRGELHLGGVVDELTGIFWENDPRFGGSSMRMREVGSLGGDGLIQPSQNVYVLELWTIAGQLPLRLLGTETVKRDGKMRWEEGYNRGTGLQS